MFAIRPALTDWMDAVRRATTSAPPAAVDAKIRRFEQPVPKITRMPRNRDGFDGADTRQTPSHGRSATAQQQASANTRSATEQARGGATDVTRFLRHDGFESATRKPVELSPKPPPSFKAEVPVFRFR